MTEQTVQTPGHILVVDDEDDVRDLICGYLEEEGYRCMAAADGDGMRDVLAGHPVDLVILDLKLPREDGLSLTRYLRGEKPGIGIIILTGKGAPVDRVVGLEMGADDYVSKPFDLRELLARVRSVTRRVQEAARAAEVNRKADVHDISVPRELIRFAGWTFDVPGRELTDPAGKSVPLTTAEFTLLSTFVKRPNQVFNRDQLLSAVNNREWEPYDRSIDVLVMRLRRKLETDTSNPELIKTVRGVGYIFTPRVQRA